MKFCEGELPMGQVCVVVGVGPGVGIAVARRFGLAGFRVALVARRADKLAAYVDELARENIEGSAFVADAERPETVADAIHKITADVGAPNVLVYNAAVVRAASPANLGVDALLRDLKVDVGSALVAAQKVLPDMIARGSGTLLFTGGGLALEPWPDVASLAVGKSGLRALAICFAKELAPKGIHAATVTIAGVVRRGSSLDPDKIAENYYELHQQARDAWETERILR
jgi:NAD(P)-dependent dehydrogenase (short-subunit alcohol dehydrogenase family)